MNRLYSNIDMDDNSPSAEDDLIEIAAQTIECGVFLQQYMSNTGGQPQFTAVQVLQVLMVKPFLLTRAKSGVGDAENCIQPFKRSAATWRGARAYPDVIKICIRTNLLGPKRERYG